MSLSIRGLGVTYGSGSEPVLRDLDLHVGPGEVVLLVGGSGSGKSSVVRAANGLCPHLVPGQVTGEILAGGLDPRQHSLAQVGTRVATVLQNPRTQFFSTDVRSELGFALDNRGVEPAEVRERVDAVIELLRLEPLLGRPMWKLSGGEQQRVAIASAFVSGCPVVLLDEPTASLDVQSVGEVRQAVRLLAARGVAVFVAEHRTGYLRGLVDRVVRLDAGVAVESWSGEDFYALTTADLARRGLRDHATAAAASLGVEGASRLAAGDEDLALSKVRVVRDRREVIAGLDVALAAGSVTVVRGDCGTGKSTLGRLVCGLVETRRPGHIHLGGQRVRARRRRRLSGMVFQDVNRQLLASTVLEEVMIGNDLGEQAARRLLGQLGIAQLTERHPLTLSGGQRQRVATAAAVAEAPKVLVLDEPTSGLDLAGVQMINAILDEQCREGRLVMLLTHDDELAVACQSSTSQTLHLGEPPAG